MNSVSKIKGGLKEMALALSVMVMVAAAASAQWQRGPGGPGGLPFRELNLTAEQQNQIRAIQEKSMEAMQATRDQMRTIAEQRKAIVQAPAFDAAAARELAAREAALQADISVARMETENAIYNVLTAEQKAKLAELEKNRPQGPPQGRRP